MHCMYVQEPILIHMYVCMNITDACVTLFQHGVISANAKLALFFDWLLYNKDVDNIMNVGECYPCNLSLAMCLC